MFLLQELLDNIQTTQTEILVERMTTENVTCSIQKYAPLKALENFKYTDAKHIVKRVISMEFSTL